MLEIPRRRGGGGLQAIQRKTGSKQGMRLNAIRCLPMRRRGSGDLEELGRKEKGDPGPGAWGTPTWGMGQTGLGWAASHCGTCQNADWRGVCRLPVVRLR
jgi:hypothetical protein